MITKSHILMMSIATGFFTLAFLRIEVPIGIMVGLTIFATVFALADMYDKFLEDIHLADQHRIKKFILKLIRFSVKMLIVLSIPISIIMAITTFTSKSIMTAEEIQRFMTLYTIGLLFFTISFDFETKKDKKHKDEIDKLKRVIEDLTNENTNN